MDLSSFAHVDWLALAQKVAYTVMAVGGAAGLVLGWIRGFPLLKSRARLADERDTWHKQYLVAERDRSELREMVKAYGAGMDALRFIEAKIEVLERTQVIALRYIVDLIQHILDGGEPTKMPPIPHEIGDEVRDEIRARSERPQTAGVSLSAAGEAATA